MFKVNNTDTSASIGDFQKVNTSCRSSHQRRSMKKVVLNNFAKFSGTHMRKSVFFNSTLLKKRQWHKCFPVNFAKFLRKFFFIDSFCSWVAFLKKESFKRFLCHFLFSFHERIKKLQETGHLLNVYQRLSGVKFSNTSSSPTLKNRYLNHFVFFVPWFLQTYYVQFILYLKKLYRTLHLLICVSLCLTFTTVLYRTYLCQTSFCRAKFVHPKRNSIFSR